MPGAVKASAIFGMEGTRLTRDEVGFFREINPYGFILFARNCETPEQIRALVLELKDLLGEQHLPILIDQEGGRVARLKPPHWPKYPPAGAFANIFSANEKNAVEATYLNARLIASDLNALGITVDCAPLADLPVEGAHDIIGDRAFGRKPEQVVALARAMARGIMPVGSHPGAFLQALEQFAQLVAGIRGVEQVLAPHVQPHARARVRRARATTGVGCGRVCVGRGWG